MKPARLLGAVGAALLPLGAGPARHLAAQPAPSAGAAPAAAPAARRAPALASHTLENGLDVLVTENHSVPLATVMVVVRTGAMTQTADEQGVPHLFEHMLFRGYRGVGERPFDFEAAELQAASNGTTSEEMVTYYLVLPSSRVEQGIALVARLVRDARFREDDLRTERFVVLGEMQRGESEPQRVLYHDVARELWRDGWARKNTIGDPVSLLAVTPKRLEAIYREWYVPNNAALVVTGDVSAARVHEAARRHFGGWRRRADPFAANPVPPMPPLEAARGLVVPGDSGTVTVMLQWRGPSVRTDPAATYDADALADVLNDEQSAFHGRLVDGGAFQSASLGYRTLAHTGPVSFVGTTTPDQLAAALSALAVELGRMRQPDYVGEAELAVAAKRRRVAQSFEQEEGVTVAHALAHAWAVEGLPYHRTYVDSMARRTPRDVNRFVTTYLAGRPFVAGVLAPAGRERETASILGQFIEMAGEEIR